MTLLLLACLMVGTIEAQGQSQLVGSDSVQVMFAKPGYDTLYVHRESSLPGFAEWMKGKR